MVRSTAKNPKGRRNKSSGQSGDALPTSTDAGLVVSKAKDPDSTPAQPPKNGGWREIEARREKAALRASLADVWDEDFDLDDEILAELDHTAEFFTTQEDPEEAIFEDEDDDVDEYFEDDDEV